MRWVFDDDIVGDSDSNVSYPKLKKLENNTLP